MKSEKGVSQCVTKLEKRRGYGKRQRIGDVWVMDIFQGIVIGVFIGVFSGLTLWLLELGKNRFWSSTRSNSVSSC